MKKNYILKLVLFVLLTVSLSRGYAQEYRENFKLNDTLMYTSSSEKLDNGDIKITIQQLDNASNIAEFTLTELKLSSFIEIFTYKMQSLYPDFENISQTYKDMIEQFAKEQFFRISLESLLEAEDDAPVIGKLKISDSVTLRQRIKIGKKCSQDCDTCKNGENCDCDKGEITIEDVEMEVLDGFIETIKVKGKANEKDIPDAFRFENKYGIGFSTRGNFKKFDDIVLFDAIQNDSSYFINLGELLDYDYFIRQSNKDYSPKNEVYRTFGGKEIELKKEENSKLFEFIVFSDFMGFENDNPNGLVQVEFAKKIVLRTSRRQMFGGGIGAFQYIKPTFLISKIEENNRYLFPEKVSKITSDSLAGSVLVNSLKTSPLDMLNYQRLSLGLDLNFLFIDSPESKIHFQVDFGFKFGRTLVRDSISSLNDEGMVTNTGLINDFGVNYFTAYPIIRIQFFPDERFGLTLSTQYQYFMPAFNDPELVTYSKDGLADSNYKRIIGSQEILGFWKPSSLKGTVFVRWRFNHQIGNITHNFHQLQTGISFFITNNK
ncbi:MAG: hypothetical protein IH598_09835 [Bacteroidales bacterium]|nr:hypothetical protein [Bacteroidales bacterium]